MRLNLFARSQHPNPEPQPQPQPQPSIQPDTTPVRPPTGRTFPADEVVWGIVIRNGFDELDDPVYHRGTTQHAYLEGNDNVAICGFRPPQSGPRTRRRSRLGLPTSGDHPMCGSCARMVVAPRPRVPVAVRPGRPPVAVPVARPVQPGPVPVSVAQAVPPPPPTAPMPMAPATQGATPSTSPWVRNRTGAGEAADTVSIELGTRHDSGLMQRGVHTELQPD